MKKILALLCMVLLLPSCGLAETLQERVNAPKSVQGEYQSATGKTHVSLDATITVPDAISFPIYEVKPRLFTPEEVVKAGDLIFGQGNWVGEYSPGDELGYVKESDVECSIGDSFTCMINKIADPAWYVRASYIHLSAVANYNAFVQLLYTKILSSEPGENTSRDVGTLEDAVAVGDAFVNKLWPDLHFSFADEDMTEHFGHSDYGYRLYYARSVAGLPVTYVSQQGANDALENYSRTIPYEKLFVDVGANGIFAFDYENPVALGALLEADPVLLPFSQIMDIFGKLAPLTIASTEYARNNSLYINRITLGYMCVQMKDHPDRSQIIPVWDFFGIRSIDDERYDEYGQSLVTINAMDGMLIDREMGY